MKLRTLLLVLVLGLNSLYGANILLNPSFETPVVGSGGFLQLGTGSSSLTDWIVTGAACGTNCILILDTNYAEGSLTFNAQAGNQSLDLTGGYNTVDGGVQQTVNLATDTNYLLTFWVGNMDNRDSAYSSASAVQLVINGISIDTFTNSASTDNLINWAQFSFNFTPTQDSNAIQFVNATGANDNFAGLDNVSLDVASAGVPEPATFGIMALALGGIAAFRRRFVTK